MKNTTLNFLPVYDDRYIKIKIRTYGDKVYTNFRGLNGQSQKNMILDKQMIHYLGENPVGNGEI